MGKNILFYSDCSFFAGCENMLANFFQSEEFMARYNVSFLYRYSGEYEAGFRQRVTRSFRAVPVKLLDLSAIFDRISKRSPFIRVPVIMFCHLILKHLFISWNTIRLFRLFRRETIDILHVNNGGYPGAYSCAAAVIAARLSGIRRIVYVVNNIAHSYRPPWRWLDIPYDTMVIKAVSLFVTGSSYARGMLVDALRIDPAKTVNIFNGIEPRAVTETRVETLRRLEVKEDRLLIGVVAVLERRKGHAVLIDAMRLLKQEAPAGLPLVLIEGEGVESDHLRHYVRDEGLDDDVRFTGSERNVFNLMNAVDIIVLPSIGQEDFPNVILEAMSLGKTVIASIIAGIPEQIVHMHDGILVEAGNARDLADAIRSVVEDGGLRESLALNARQKFSRTFSAQRSVRNYEELYEKLLAQGERA
ncbi:MAG: glycosyltransferase [Syntrophorhabdaceae bacterium]|nr:glycosyltransferase [Syntrophorhabdaceae bacterium]